MTGGPIFHTGSDHPGDLLINAKAVCRFLADVSPLFTEEGGKLGLSTDGADGLGLILTGIENTIQAAVQRL